MKYLIQDTRDSVGNCASFWRPGGRGYTCDVDEAGRFTEEEADEIEKNPVHMRIPEAEVLAACVRHLRVDTNDGRFCLRRKKHKPTEAREGEK